MSYTKKITIKDLEIFTQLFKINIPIDEVRKRIDNGEQLTETCSSFTDPGEDWGEISLNGQTIATWTGY